MPCGAVNQHTLRELFLVLSGLILFNPFWLLSGDEHRGFCNPLHVLKMCGIFDQTNTREDGVCDGKEIGRQFFLCKVTSILRIVKQKLGYPYRSVAYFQTVPGMQPMKSATLKCGLKQFHWVCMDTLRRSTAISLFANQLPRSKHVV